MARTLTLLYRRLERLPWPVRMLVLSAVVLVTYGLLVVVHVSTHDYIRDPVFLGEDKCPACYGTSLCEDLHSGKIHFTSFSKVRLTDYLNTKNVFFAERDDGTQLVLKKLAFNSELRDIDAKICKFTSGRYSCDVSKYFSLSKFATSREIDPGLFANLTDMVHCPSQRLLVKILDNYREKQSDSELHAQDRMYVGYTLSVNSEPILMQVKEEIKYIL